MKISLKRTTYQGVDGTSLSDERSKQIVLIYDFIQQYTENITYKELQKLADDNHLFGNTLAHSCIRTIFPLLRKLHFVSYDGYFNKDTLFTSLGKMYVIVEKTIMDTREVDNASFSILKNIRQIIIQEGLSMMYKDEDYKNHKIWIVLDLFRTLDTLDWREYALVLYEMYEKYHTFGNAIMLVKELRSKNEVIELYKENGDSMDSTCYIYMCKLLIEAGLVGEYENKHILLDEGRNFINQINR